VHRDPVRKAKSAGARRLRRFTVHLPTGQEFRLDALEP
jgi:hypothetical protein